MNRYWLLRIYAVSDIASDDVVIGITTGAPEGRYISLKGEMSYQHYRNSAAYNGKDLENGKWKALKSYAWRHTAGSKSYKYSGTSYSVTNGSILLLNDSNQYVTYTITYTNDPGKNDWAYMTFTTDENGKVTSAEDAQDTIIVVVPPNTNVTVVGQMNGEAENMNLTESPVGSITIDATPSE